MKPLTSNSTDVKGLEQLGRASVQIIHDLKNQLNGLKLYATFLKKRLEKAGGPTDEQETVSKLISGLDRAAADMTALVRLGKPLELRKQKSVDLSQLLRRATAEVGGIQVEIAVEPLTCDVDATALGEAIKTICNGALSRASGSEAEIKVRLWIDRESDPVVARIEWQGINRDDPVNPFDSYIGSEGLRMSLAARIIAAHDGEVSRKDDRLAAWLPVATS